ncbi:MAG: hypothetical protein JW854_06095 [Actinobacteria bacterium]|nr:hypothetical protein [Actinomycetota bacterium]
MGTTALIVFLASLAVGFLCLMVLVWSTLRIYRTARYAYKDSQSWTDIFREHAETLGDKVKTMESRAQNISRTGQEIRENMDDIQDAIEELRTHPLLRGAHYVGRFRKGSS